MDSVYSTPPTSRAKIPHLTGENTPPHGRKSVCETASEASRLRVVILVILASERSLLQTLPLMRKMRLENQTLLMLPPKRKALRHQGSVGDEHCSIILSLHERLYIMGASNQHTEEG
jgi:hypothetical protein